MYRHNIQVINGGISTANLYKEFYKFQVTCENKPLEASPRNNAY